MPQSASHRRSLYPLAEALGERGHQVTFFAEMAFDDGVRSTHPNVKNQMTLIDHDDPAFYELWAYRNSSSFRDIQWRTQSDYPWIWNVYWGMMIDVCRITVQQRHEDLQSLITDHKWDLIVIDGIFAACGVALTRLIKAPYIILNPTTITAAEASHRGLPYPASVVAPIASLVDYDHRIFYHRLHGAVSYVVEYLMPFSWDRLLQKAVRPKFPSLENFPLVTWFYGHPELSYTDLPQTFEHPRPMLPDIVNIAGHCKTGSPVLDDPEWLKFLDDPSSKGTILLSFGHIVQWMWAPEEIIDNLFAAFDHFPDYRIVFQYDGPLRPNRSHVKTSTWLPVVGILHHPKSKVHLTHGGIKSVTESACASVPLIIMPVFAEQIRNAHLVKKMGGGVALDKFDLTVDNIVNALRSVLENDSYSHRMRSLKAFMTETLRPPLDLGVFWAEKTLKMHGLPVRYFKDRGRGLSWIAYWNLDVLVLASVVLILVVGLFAKVVSRMCSSFW